MSASAREYAQIAVWIVAVLGGVVAGLKAIHEMKQANIQRRHDLRWKQAEMAKTCIDEVFANSLACVAMKILDWSGSRHLLPDGSRSEEITHERRREALRVVNTVFPDAESPFIRDAYDALFDGLSRLEHFISIDLIVFEDVAPAFRYHARLLLQPIEWKVFDAYLTTYSFELAAAFIARFRESRAA